LVSCKGFTKLRGSIAETQQQPIEKYGATAMGTPSSKIVVSSEQRLTPVCHDLPSKIQNPIPMFHAQHIRSGWQAFWPPAAGWKKKERRNLKKDSMTQNTQ
jgi:hypothetical protein